MRQAHASRTRSVLSLFAAVLVAAVGGGPAASAQADGRAAPGGEAPAKAPPPPTAADAEKAKLDARFAELEHQAALLAADYKKALERRVAEIARDNPTLKRLREAGIFTADGLTAGLPAKPLESLPWLRRALEGVEERAVELAQEFGSQAKAHNERVALSTLKRIAKAQKVFREEDRDGDAIMDYADDLRDLSRYRLFERKARNGFKANGYIFRVLYGDIARFAATAVPERPGETGDTYFFVDETGKIRYARDRAAGPKSPLLPGQ